MKLFRVIIPVGDIDQAARGYGEVLAMPGTRVSPGRHYFDCDGVILACYDAERDGDDASGFQCNPDHVYLACDDLTDTLTRVEDAAGFIVTDPIATRPWGEHSFYARDPWKNPICFVDASTVFTG